MIYGERIARSFRSAATKYLRDNQHKRSIGDDALHLKQLDPFIGDLDIRAVHIGTLGRFIEARRQAGIKTKSINLALGVVRHILNVAASEWIDESGLTWLERPPKIKMLPVTDARKPYPLSWEEQTRLFKELPDHLARMALFKVNTGCREQEVCGLRWEWEIDVPELGTSVFLIPEEKVKNGDERLVVLNSVAKSVIESLRGEHPTYVFTYCGHRQKKMNNSGWRNSQGKSWIVSGSSSRPETYFWSTTAGCGRVFRGSTGLAWTQIGTNYEPLLGSGIDQPYRGCEQSCWTGVPQKSRTGSAKEKSGYRVRH